MSLDKYRTEDLHQELILRKYRKNDTINIYIPSYCVERFMKISNSKNRLKSYKTLCKMYLGAESIQMKPLEKIYRLLNNNCQEAQYFHFNGWIIVIVKDRSRRLVMKTVYLKKDNNWFVKV